MVDLPTNNGEFPNAKVKAEFVNEFSSVNDLPRPSDIAFMGFDIFAAFWFGFLSGILDKKLGNFAQKLNFVAEVQQSLSNVSTNFEQLKQLTTYKSDAIPVDETSIKNLSRAFYSLVRMQYIMTQTYLLSHYPSGATVNYTLSHYGRYIVRVQNSAVVAYTGVLSGSPAPLKVANPIRDTSLANKIATLTRSLATPNTSQTSTNGHFTSVTPYQGSLVQLLLANDPFFGHYYSYNGNTVTFNNASTFSSEANTAFTTPWSTQVESHLNIDDIRSELEGLTTQYISWQNVRDRYATKASSSVLSDASTDASTGVTAAQSVSSQTEIKLDQFEQVENMYNNIRSQVQQTIAQRNILVIKNMNVGK